MLNLLPENYLDLPRAGDPTETIKYKEDERACEYPLNRSTIAFFDSRTGPECRSAISARKLYSRSAFLPTDEEIELAINPRPAQPTRQPKYERIDSDIEMEIVEGLIDKGKGKGKAIPKSKRKKPYVDSEDDEEHSSEDDGLSDFIADEDEDSEDEKAARKRLSKRLGKKRAIVLDSDEEAEESDDGEVLFGRPSPIMADIPKEQIRMMPRFLPSTKMKVSF